MVTTCQIKMLLRRLIPGALFAFLSYSSLIAGQPQNIEVSITTHLGDQQSFVEGDVISFLLTLNSDAYIYLFYKDAENNIFLIYPNQKSSSQLFKSGFFIPLPPKEQHFQFKIQAPFGEETLYAIASDNPQVSLAGKQLENGLSLIDSSIREIETSLRQQSKDGFGISELKLTSRPK